ncbi:LOW QUALITY PROTEIN: protein NLRC3-like [Xyrichtys novacula]|nr:LOW QUALITY PROTEIN: protein NLRC3-like [Xyrichtys novacula]
MQDSEIELLCDFLGNPECRLETLKLSTSSLSEISCASLASALISNRSPLRELDVNCEYLEESGRKLLCELLGNPNCHLESLSVKDKSCSGLSLACLEPILKRNPSYLSVGKLQDSAARHLQDYLRRPDRELTLKIVDEQQQEANDGFRVSAAVNIPAQEEVTAEEKLKLARKRFVDSVSDPVLNDLLDVLLKHEVINNNEMESLRSKIRADKARVLIDAVRAKGTEASLVLINALCEVDQYLSKKLDLV